MRDAATVRGFSSIKDLLDAREAYHVHLTAMTGVQATAIGLHRFRPGESGYDDPVAPGDNRTDRDAPARRLDNSVVRDWSWPCVLVFVDRIRAPLELADADGRMYDLVPRLLYLSDGRIVPTCVIEAPLEPAPEADRPSEIRNRHIVGGGYPVVTTVQSERHRGALACLVSDGDTTYALTTRHVTGPKGRPIHVELAGGDLLRIGESHRLQVGKIAFESAYPAWRGSHVQVNVDAGLVRLDKLDRVTAEVHGIGKLDELYDLSDDTLSLDLIGRPVRAFGAATGAVMEGEIQALFYRYQARGGVENTTELLIGPRLAGSLLSRPGDSGTLWVLEEQEAPPSGGEPVTRLRPIAMQWGGHVMAGGAGEGTMRFALATALSTICRVLDVDLVRNLHVGQVPWFGRVGHITIAEVALPLVHSAALRTWLSQKSKADGGLRYLDELAVLPDKIGTKTTHVLKLDARSPEAPHQMFLDVTRDGFSLRRLVDFAGTFPQAASVGLLPLAVAWLYERMVEALRANNGDRFLCAAGTLAHMLGDAAATPHLSTSGSSSARPDIHGLFDKLPEESPEIVVALRELLDAEAGTAKATVRGPSEAAARVFAHLEETAEKVPMDDLIEIFDAQRGAARRNVLLARLQEPIVEAAARAARLLAELWESAWREGAGDRAKLRLTAKSMADFEELYASNEFKLPPHRELMAWIDRQSEPPSTPPRKRARKAPRPRRSSAADHRA